MKEISLCLLSLWENADPCFSRNVLVVAFPDAWLASPGGWGAVRTSQPFRGVLGVQPLSHAPQCVQVTPVSCCTIFSLIGHLTSGHQHPCSVEVMWEQEKELGCVQASSGLCLLWRALYFQVLVFFLITKTNAGLRRWSRGWESICQCRGHGFDPWSRKIAHAEE